MTIDQIKKKLQRGTGFPPTPMPEAELNAYISALEAHLGGGTQPAKKTTTTTTKPRDRFLKQMDTDFEAFKKLVNGTPANIRPTGELNQKAALALFNIDRDFFLKVAQKAPKKEEKKEEEKPEFNFEFIADRSLGFQIQVKGLDKVLAHEKIKEGNYHELLDRMLKGDKKLIGNLDDDLKPNGLSRVDNFLESLSAEELDVAVSHPMMNVYQTQPAEFKKHFSAVSMVSQFIAEVGKFQSSKPKDVIACMTSRYLYKETLDEMESQLPDKESYYASSAPSQMMAIIDSAVSDQLTVVFREVVVGQGFKQKANGVQQEYKYFERNFREKATPNAATAKQNWIVDDRQEAVVPMLYAMNLLSGGSVWKLAKRHQDKDKGKWSPHYMDMFLDFAHESKGPGKKVTYLTEINQLCLKIVALGVYDDTQQATGAQISVIDATTKNINRCKIVTGKVDSLKPDWARLLSKSSEITKRLEKVEQKVLKASGNTTANLIRKRNGNPDWDEVKTVARKYAVEELSREEIKGEQRIYEPQSLFDDFTIRQGLHTFCHKVKEHSANINYFWGVGNEPPTEES
jgi:hypothetical protein